MDVQHIKYRVKFEKQVFFMTLIAANSAIYTSTMYAIDSKGVFCILSIGAAVITQVVFCRFVRKYR